VRCAIPNSCPNTGYAGQFALRVFGWRKSPAAWLSSWSLGSIANMSYAVRCILFGLCLLGLCSCASVAPTSVGDNDATTFIYVANVRYFAFVGMDHADKIRMDGWHFASSALDAAGIKYSAEGDMGIMSISVQRSRCDEAIELLRRDAKLKDYWIKIVKDVR
jgi:hypothetical protein